MIEITKDIKKKIMNLIKENPMSISELSRQLKLRREFVAGYLEAMRHSGDVKLVRVGKSKVYIPK